MQDKDRLFRHKPQNILNIFVQLFLILDLLGSVGERKVSCGSHRGEEPAGTSHQKFFSRMYGTVSHNSDVHSYGMLVLEMLELSIVHTEANERKEIYKKKER